MSNVNEVTDATFENEVLKSSMTVLVDFWAPWCGPCRALAPVVDEIANDFTGKLKVLKINTDENPKTAQSYRISGIPSLLIFKNGQPVEQVVGAVSKDTISGVVNKHLN